MELVFGLWLLYALHCTVWLPRGAALFLRPLHRWRALPGPGWRPLHGLPSATAIRATRFPLHEVDGSLVARRGGTWWDDQRLSDGEWRLERADLSLARNRGSLVLLGQRPIARLANEAEAAELARALRETAPGSGDVAAGRLAEILGRQHSLACFDARWERVRAAARPLAWASDVYGIALLLALPGLLLALGAESGLWIALPGLAALHLAALAALAVAQRRLHPGPRRERVEAWVSALLYPPGLLRAHQELVAGAVGSFHPAVVAMALLPAAARDRFLRAEVLRARDGAGRGGTGLARREWELLAELLTARHLTVDALLAAPARRDGLAESYCPVCHAEYRRERGSCSECAVDLAAYAG